MTYKGAIHIHSNYSHDSNDSLETLRKTCIEREIRFLGMSDHAEDLSESIFSEYLHHCRSVSDESVQLIAGLEYRFPGLKGMHLLALGLERWINPRTPEEFFELAQGNARMTVLAHPILTKYDIPEVVLERVDAIEVWNGGYNTRYLPDPTSISILRETARKRPEVVATVGLDQHDSSNDRELRIALSARTSDPIAEIKAGRFINASKTMTFDSKASFSSTGFFFLKTSRALLDVVDKVQDTTVITLRRFQSGIRRTDKP